MNLWLLKQGDCWLWQRRFCHGYGVVRLLGRMRYVHRLMYAAVNGPVRVPLVSRCPRRCCNPAHWRLKIAMLALIAAVAVPVLAADPTIAELKWHKEAIEAKMERDKAQSQFLQLDFANLTAELASVNAEIEKKENEAKAAPPSPPPPAK